MKIYGHVVEIGEKIAIIQLTELETQGRCEEPILIPSELEDMVMGPIASERLETWEKEQKDLDERA